jgi:hypothetical protein
MHIVLNLAYQNMRISGTSYIVLAALHVDRLWRSHWSDHTPCREVTNACKYSVILPATILTSTQGGDATCSTRRLARARPHISNHTWLAFPTSHPSTLYQPYLPASKTQLLLAPSLRIESTNTVQQSTPLRILDETLQEAPATRQSATGISKIRIHLI